MERMQQLGSVTSIRPVHVLQMSVKERKCEVSLDSLTHSYIHDNCPGSLYQKAKCAVRRTYTNGEDRRRAFLDMAAVLVARMDPDRPDVYEQIVNLPYSEIPRIGMLLDNFESREGHLVVLRQVLQSEATYPPKPFVPREEAAVSMHQDESRDPVPA